MTRKSLGYVELEWTCPSCGYRNPGTATICESCGAPQPDDIKFEQPAEETVAASGELAERAKAGPDVHCDFCGTRNPADAQQCSQCFAELSNATARDSGQVLGAHRDKSAPDVICEYCDTPNPASARRCQNCASPLPGHEPQPAPKPMPKMKPASRGLPRWLFMALGLLVLGVCGTLIFLSVRTEEAAATVQSVNWERTIAVEALQPVEREAWRDNIPTNAEVLSCRQELRDTSSQPAPNSREVCGTPYTVDTGTGVGEVVQDCVYEIYADRCDYTVQEWTVVNTLISEGSGGSPAWPALNLQGEQREGEREETYEVVFRGDGRNYTYTPADMEEYGRYRLGSEWIIEVNGLGNVVSTTPAN